MTQFLAPPPTRGHAAVWTGSRLFIWGGELSDRSTTNHGAIYDPEKDRWQTMSLSGAPDPRAEPTAIWLGDRLLIWGGYTTQKREQGVEVRGLATGAIYHPASDSWQPISAAFAPLADQNHRAVWTGSELVVCNVPEPAKYDPARDQWTLLSNAGAPLLRQHTRAYWSGEYVVVWGGLEEVGGVPLVQTDGARYHPASDTWHPISRAGLPATFGDQVITLQMDRRLLVLPTQHSEGINLLLPYIYDPAIDVWKRLPVIDAPRNPVQDFIYGKGLRPRYAAWTGSAAIFWNENRILNLTTERWSSHIGHHALRLGQTKVGFCWGDGLAYTFGGENAAGTAVAGGSLLDPFTNFERRLPTENAPHLRADPTMVWTGDELIVWGGSDRSFSLRGEIKSDEFEGIDLFNSGAIYTPE